MVGETTATSRDRTTAALTHSFSIFALEGGCHVIPAINSTVRVFGNFHLKQSLLIFLRHVWEEMGAGAGTGRSQGLVEAAICHLLHSAELTAQHTVWIVCVKKLISIEITM